jgi:hypothetical protein
MVFIEEITLPISVLVAIIIFFDMNQNIVKQNSESCISKDLDKIKNIDHPDFKSASISTLYKIEKGRSRTRIRMFYLQSQFQEDLTL